MNVVDHDVVEYCCLSDSNDDGELSNDDKDVEMVGYSYWFSFSHHLFDYHPMMQMLVVDKVHRQ